MPETPRRLAAGPLRPVSALRLSAMANGRAHSEEPGGVPSAAPAPSSVETGRPRPVLALLVSMLLLFAVAAGSRVPMGHASDQGMVRLSWLATGPIVKVEKAAPVDPSVPVHMRPPSTFERRPVPFRLVASLDGRVLADRSVSPEGLRGDRPVVVAEDWPVPPGRYRLQVSFVPQMEPGAEVDGTRSVRDYALDTEVTVAAGRIVLVTMDEDAKHLVVR